VYLSHGVHERSFEDLISRLQETIEVNDRIVSRGGGFVTNATRIACFLGVFF
jgi:hypothetical protein